MPETFTLTIEGLTRAQVEALYQAAYAAAVTEATDRTPAASWDANCVYEAVYAACEGAGFYANDAGDPLVHIETEDPPDA